MLPTPSSPDLAATAPRAGLVLLALAMGGFAIGVTEFSAMAVLPDFARGLGIDAPTAGHVISAYALGVVLGAPLIAVLGAHLPRRTLLIGLMALFAIGNGLSALAPTYGWMLPSGSSASSRTAPISVWRPWSRPRSPRPDSGPRRWRGC